MAVAVAPVAGLAEAEVADGLAAEGELEDETEEASMMPDVESEDEVADTGAFAWVVEDEAELEQLGGGLEFEYTAVVWSDAEGGHMTVAEPVIAYEHEAVPQHEAAAVG